MLQASDNHNDKGSETTPFVGGLRDTLRCSSPFILKLEGAHNMRDLGGYPTPAGPIKHGRFVRSASVSELDHDAVAALRNYGIRQVLDLRSAGELMFSPNRFAELSDQGFSFQNVELASYNMSDPAFDRGDEDGLLSFLTSGYFAMLSYKYAIRACFRFLSQAGPKDGTLFHCAAGKDRTGIIALLLLALAGVSREHIICDYCYSFASVDEVNALVLEGGTTGSRHNKLARRRDAIGLVYDRLLEVHGSVHNYLLSCGVNDKTIDRVSARLLA